MVKVEFDNRARKELRKLDSDIQDRILTWLRERIAEGDDSRNFGKPMKGQIKGLWRYKIGQYRVLCQIQDEEQVVFVVRIGHRRDVYK